MAPPTPSSVFRASNTALITGGASGIGLAVAALCRKAGMNLALVDNNAELLARAKKELPDGSAGGDGGSGSGGAAKIETYEMDVSKAEQWAELRTKVKASFERVDFLMLNAGVGAKGGWENLDYFHKILNTNLFGVINGLSTFVPVLQSQQTSLASAIVITGSKQGITNPPGNPAYNASKAAVKALAEHLSYDLRGSNTSVHLLVPGWTFTGLSGGQPGGGKEKPAGAWAPEQVAEFLRAKMDQGKFWALCPDNDVDEQTDRRRMMWTAGDAVYNRLPLSRWREEYKSEAEEWMAQQKFESF